MSRPDDLDAVRSLDEIRAEGRRLVADYKRGVVGGNEALMWFINRPALLGDHRIALDDTVNALCEEVDRLRLLSPTLTEEEGCTGDYGCIADRHIGGCFATDVSTYGRRARVSALIAKIRHLSGSGEQNPHDPTCAALAHEAPCNCWRSTDRGEQP